MAPPTIGYDDPRQREEYRAMLQLRDSFSMIAAAVAVVGVVLGVVLTSWATAPAPCTFAVTRFFEVDPDVFSGASGDSSAEGIETKAVGGVRQTIRAIQLTMGLQLAELTDDFGPSDGMWWVARGEERVIVDTKTRAIAGTHASLVLSPSTNVTRLVAHNVDPCSEAARSALEPSISTDSAHFTMKHRDWRASSLSEAGKTARAFRATSIRVESRRSLHLHALERAQAIFPALRRAHSRGSLAPVLRRFVHEAVFVSSDGFAVKLHVVCNTAGDPVKQPELVRSIVVSLDCPPHSHTRVIDSA
eukprot:CAMPEP_0174834214 /NCGR_PEP_ID=MMETSP1114-20130205/4699_1 /TAXON_ID=312471 /ORGANISM="Neobodo designis, Strain CCAP 1951/1" /LENGTH=302 /DNA_ID=CAMNT_0016068121 /DNA_START=27 /DNA_END=931 /DNA_ORIENTATION=+